MTARSVLASTLLGVEPPELPVSHLVHLASLFGINENRARVALSRMVSSGEATSDGTGRYRLTGHLLERQRRQSLSRRGLTGPWSGGWHTVVVVGHRRSPDDRARRRRSLAAARLAERRDGTWLRPDNVELRLSDEIADDVLVISGGSVADPAGLASTLWDLPAWIDRSTQLLEDLDRLSTITQAGLAPGFILSAAVLRHLQSDPLLPTELLPVGWSGAALRSTYEDWDHRYRTALGEWAGAAPSGSVEPSAATGG